MARGVTALVRLKEFRDGPASPGCVAASDGTRATVKIRKTFLRGEARCCDVPRHGGRAVRSGRQTRIQRPRTRQSPRRCGGDGGTRGSCPEGAPKGGKGPSGHDSGEGPRQGEGSVRRPWGRGGPCTCVREAAAPPRVGVVCSEMSWVTSPPLGRFMQVSG